MTRKHPKARHLLRKWRHRARIGNDRAFLQYCNRGGVAACLNFAGNGEMLDEVFAEHMRGQIERASLLPAIPLP